MTGICFVDTNILVYFRDASEPEKQARSGKWLAELWRLRKGQLSFQVLNEYYVTVTQKLNPGLDSMEARADIRNLIAWQPISINQGLIESAWIIQDQYQFSWWDSLIVSAAQQVNSNYLLTEDLQHEQQLGGVTIINPFIQGPVVLPG
ncbi:PIN domain-containing protein [Nitrosococcus watsonii]|uniref:PilT domain-containing protein n=1 Tax=Nitrosococcus watsoni (strain C-113) TaxID=105559 RepID=D8K940_NITWC|nr:PIN domain-containing protein [Nitrosococcus watsonii]ADJ29183.1 PilT domain-containing protein [Nitrosococcus watsonii C-113]